mgnify:CR=1 FL=1
MCGREAKGHGDEGRQLGEQAGGPLKGSLITQGHKSKSARPGPASGLVPVIEGGKVCVQGYMAKWQPGGQGTLRQPKPLSGYRLGTPSPT